MVRDDFTADLRLVRNTMLRVGVGCGGVGWRRYICHLYIFFKS